VKRVMRSVVCEWIERRLMDGLTCTGGEEDDGYRLLDDWQPMAHHLDLHVSTHHPRAPGERALQTLVAGLAELQGLVGDRRRPHGEILQGDVVRVRTLQVGPPP
jgi:hypothetical protein